MYGNKLAAAIKGNGKVLREFKDTVYIPFGAEYTILVKNLHTTRAVVNIYIDGDNVVPGGLVLNAGQEIDLERSIRNNNLTEGNCFKFIERTGAIEQHRGVKLEDGLIRIEHQFELPRPVFNTNNPWLNPSETLYYPPGVRDFVCSTASSGVLRGQSLNSTISATSATLDCSFSDTGITVPGSKSQQQFTTTVMGALESAKHSMVIRLLGDLGNNKPVTKAVTVKHKPKCVTCGKQNKAHAKFCTECGTALEIFA